MFDNGAASPGKFVNAGFNSGVAGNYYSLPGSQTADDLKFACSGLHGCYTFRVDQATIAAPSYSQTQSQAPTLSSSASSTTTPSASRGLSASQALTATQTQVATRTGTASPTPSSSYAPPEYNGTSLLESQAVCPTAQGGPAFVAIALLNGACGAVTYAYRN